MHMMCLQHLLDGLTALKHELSDIATTALFDGLQLKIKAFDLPDETNKLYISYLLRFLWFLQKTTRYESLQFFQDVYDAQQMILHYLVERHNHTITPLLCYVDTRWLRVSEWYQLPEVNVFQEIANCLLTIVWETPPHPRHNNLRVAYLQEIQPFIIDIFHSKSEGCQWLSRWSNQKMQLMYFCLNLLRQHAIQSSQFPNE